MRMRLATWNVQHGRRPDGMVDVDLLARGCAALDADVLGLQEIDVGAPRSGGRDEAAEAADRAGMLARFAEARPHPDGGRYGNALLVRGDMTDVEVLPLPGRGEPRVAMLARVAPVRGDLLSVAVCHLGLQGDAARQLPVVVAALADRPPPRVLLGDLNLRPEEVEAGELEVVDGGGPTFPGEAPTLRIDHVALDGLKPAAVVVPPMPVSDHRPLVVEVELL